MSNLRPVGKVTTESARRLLVAALNTAADRYTDLDLVQDEAVRLDVALLRAMADNVSGWTHTTRLREFLESNKTAETHAAYAEELADLVKAGDPA